MDNNFIVQRTIISKKDFKKNGITKELIGISSDLESPALDSYYNKLVKLIPAEIIALFLSLDTITKSANYKTLEWFIFAFCFVGTYLYLQRVTKVTKKNQIFISLGAYCVWVFAIGGPFAKLIWYDSIYAGVLMTCYTFLIPIFEI